MNSIDKHSIIDEQKLSHEYYFQSLLQEAYLRGELDTAATKRIQNECLQLLSESINRYTRGQSSSVRIETAQSLMASNAFTISLYLKSLPSTTTALEQLIHVPIKTQYHNGQAILQRKFNVAHYFFQQVCKTKISTPNHAYNVTIDHGLGLFFRQYDTDFCAHEAPSSIDYQLIHPITDLAGVEFMIQYLENLYYENLFCQKFDSNIIDEVMCGYSKDYKDLLDNLCAQVFQNALGCLLVQRPVQTLDLSPADLEKIHEELQAKSRPWITARLTDAALRLFSELGLTKASIRHYFISSLPEIITKIIAALQTDTLTKVFVPRYRPHQKPLICYDMGTRMADESYRELLDEFLSCRYLGDKLSLIKASVHALADLEDLLLAGELKSDESAQVFDLLADTELAVLFKRHPLNPEIAAIDFSASEIGLQQLLNQYRQALPPKRLAAIAKIITQLEIS